MTDARRLLAPILALHDRIRDVGRRRVRRRSERDDSPAWPHDEAGDTIYRRRSRQ